MPREVNVCEGGAIDADHAVATGLYLACPVSPTLHPLWQCMVRSISCPGRSRVIRMSEWTGSGRSFLNRSNCGRRREQSSAVRAGWSNAACLTHLVAYRHPLELGGKDF